MLYELLSKSCLGCDLCSSACPWSPTFKPSQRNAGFREAVESCTMCGKCSLACPLKVPTHKAVLEKKFKGFVPDDVKRIREKAKELGTTFGVLPDWEEIRGEGFPVEERARWLLLPGGFDLLPTSKNDFYGLMWALRKLGIDFTLSEDAPEGFGNFYFDFADPSYFKKMVKIVTTKAKELGVKGLLLSECGADYKAWSALRDKLKRNGLELSFAIIEISKRLRERVVERKVKGKTSYHDPCGLARYNFFTEEPRRVLRLISEEYEEREPGGRLQVCGGGGGGVSCSEGWKKVATEVIGPKKVEQFKGVEVVATACAKCKSMLTTYSLLLGGGFRVHRLGYLTAWALGAPLPPP